MIFFRVAIVFFPKGIRIPAQWQASIRAPPWVAVEGIAGALKGHGNAMFAIRVKQLMPEMVYRWFRCPYRANPFF